MFSWSDTLLDYLNSSNEDDRVVSCIRAEVFRRVSLFDRELRWLEIGPGPCTKTRALIEQFCALPHHPPLAVRIIEPDPGWARAVEELCGAKRLDGIHIDMILERTSFEVFVANSFRHEQHFRPNLVTLVHVVYELHLVRALLEYLTLLKTNCDPALVCIVVESDDSDFALLRTALGNLGLQVPLRAAHNMQSALRESGFDFSAVSIGQKFCQTKQESAFNEWLLAFLLGSDRDSLRAIDEDLRNGALSLIAGFVSDQRKGQLVIPDVAFLVDITSSDLPDARNQH